MSNAAPSHPRPQEQKLRDEVALRLVPMLCSAKVEEHINLPIDGKLVARDREGRIVIRSSKSTTSCFRLARTYRFSRSELTLARKFVYECVKVCKHYNTAYVDDLAMSLPRKAISQAIGYRAPRLIIRILDQFDELSNQTYERQRISAVVGLTNIPRDSGVELTKVWGEDFAKVLTSGVESMLVVDPEGRVYAHHVPSVEANHVMSPNAVRYLSEWTTDQQICLVLNRNGEILVLKNKRLEFARRRGHWLHFPHKAVLRLIGQHCYQMWPIEATERSRAPSSGTEERARVARVNKDLANKIHETCLDASFSRSGGCIAIVDSESRASFDRKRIVASDDLLGTSASLKAKAIHWLTTKGRIRSRANFANLDRRFRQELVAIDGATVMDSDGYLIAVGAIVKVRPGSASGARRAAARALAEFGLGIKISADGEVSGFLHDTDGDDDGVKENCIFRYG